MLQMLCCCDYLEYKKKHREMCRTELTLSSIRICQRQGDVYLLSS